MINLTDEQHDFAVALSNLIQAQDVQLQDVLFVVLNELFPPSLHHFNTAWSAQYQVSPSHIQEQMNKQVVAHNEFSAKLKGLIDSYYSGIDGVKLPAISLFISLMEASCHTITLANVLGKAVQDAIKAKSNGSQEDGATT